MALYATNGPALDCSSNKMNFSYRLYDIPGSSSLECIKSSLKTNAIKMCSVKTFYIRHAPTVAYIAYFQGYVHCLSG